MVQEIGSEDLVLDQIVRSCRQCGCEQKHYRIGDPVMEDGGFFTVEYQCMGCMSVRSVIIDALNLNNNIPKRHHSKNVKNNFFN